MLPDMKEFDEEAALELSLNAPTGAWCSLTGAAKALESDDIEVSMHLQVRGAP